MPKRVPISAAKRVAEEQGFRQVVIVGYDGERVHVVTYGKTKADCKSAAQAQDFWEGRIKTLAFDPLPMELAK